MKLTTRSPKDILILLAVATKEWHRKIMREGRKANAFIKLRVLFRKYVSLLHAVILADVYDQPIIAHKNMYLF